MANKKHTPKLTGDELPEDPSHGLRLGDNAGAEENHAVGAIVPDDSEEEGGE